MIQDEFDQIKRRLELLKAGEKANVLTLKETSELRDFKRIILGLGDNGE